MQQDGISWQAIEAIAAVMGVAMGLFGAAVLSLLGAVLNRLGAIMQTVGTAQAELTALNQRWMDCRDRDRSTHEDIWDHVEQHGERLADHERRITTLEE